MLDAFTVAFVAWFVTIDPPGLVPVWLALAGALPPERRARTANRAVLVAGSVLLVFALFGEAVLRTLGISLPAFRISGGLFLFLVALEMVFEHRSGRREETAGRTDAPDIAVFPLGIPLIAGPAAITTTILVSERFAGVTGGRPAVVAALLSVLALTWLGLRLAEHIRRLVPKGLAAVVSRVLGLLLGALAAQYVLDGVLQALGGRG